MNKLFRDYLIGLIRNHSVIFRFSNDLKKQNSCLPGFTFFQIIIINYQFILFCFGFCINQKTNALSFNEK